MQPRARGPNSFAQSKSASLQAVVLVATHEERADHPLQDLLPFQASFQIPTCAAFAYRGRTQARTGAGLGPGFAGG